MVPRNCLIALKINTPWAASRPRLAHPIHLSSPHLPSTGFSGCPELSFPEPYCIFLLWETGPLPSRWPISRFKCHTSGAPSLAPATDQVSCLLCFSLTHSSQLALRMYLLPDYTLSSMHTGHLHVPSLPGPEQAVAKYLSK